MDVYTVTHAFDITMLNMEMSIGDTVGRFSMSVNTLANTTQFPDKAFYGWIGSPDSLNYLSFVGVVPDPSSGGINEAHGIVALPAADSFTLAGAGWMFIPSAIACMVIKPGAPDSNMFATLRDGTLTADGFTVDFQAPIPGAGYKLSYFVIL